MRILGIAILVSILFLPACATTNPLNMQNLLEVPEGESDPKRGPFENFEAWVDKKFGVADHSETKMLRSKFIVAVIGHYAANRIVKWSGDHMEEDASLVLLRLEIIEKKLPIQPGKPPAKPMKPRSLKKYNRIKYLGEVAETIKVAVRPTKRHYRSLIMSLLSGPSAVAAARTVSGALAGMAEIVIYRLALLDDLKDLLKNVGRGNPPAASHWKDINEFYYQACKRLTRLANTDTNPCTETAKFRP